MKSPVEEPDFVRPHPSSLLQSIRSFGYSFETAICDLLDNSLTARAKTISITFGITKSGSFLRIEDDGVGMSEEQLVQAMRFGGISPLATRAASDLGRFGLGLKTASFSQCKRLTVITRQSQKRESLRCWDLD